MKILLNNSVVSFKQATKLTEQNAEWRKNLREGDEALLICVVNNDSPNKEPYSSDLFSSFGAPCHRKIRIYDTRVCNRECTFCNKYIGFIDLVTKKMNTPRCLGFSNSSGFIHIIQPLEYLQYKILVFNRNKT